VADAGAIAAPVKVLNTAKEASTLHYTLKALMNICQSRDQARAMALIAGVVKKLIEFLRVSQETVKVKEASLLALWKIYIHDNAATAAYEAGIVSILITFLESATETGIMWDACTRTLTDIPRVPRMSQLSTGVPFRRL
jgi:hypothetical protein